MEEITQDELEQIANQLGDTSQQDIWISWLVPNETLTQQFLGGEEIPDHVPNIMLHDWFYVHIDPDQFQDNGFFYTEDEPFRMGYDDEEYDIQNITQINHDVFYQSTVTLNGNLDSQLSQWLQNACNQTGVNYNQLESQLESTVLTDVSTRGPKAIVRASRFKQELPP